MQLARAFQRARIASTAVLRTLASLLGVALLCSGCGGGSDSGVPPRRALLSFLLAVANGDGAGACRLVTPAGRARFEAELQAALGQGRRLPCEELVPLIARFLPATEQAA